MGKALRTIALIILFSGVTFYAAAPFWTAWTIQQAIKSGDVKTLQTKIVWPSVRQSLRQSIINYAELQPAAAKPDSKARITFVQRIKNILGMNILDRFIDHYITAKGLPLLYRIKNGDRRNAQVDNMQTRSVRQDAGQNHWHHHQDVRTFIRRIRRIEFRSLSRVEIETADRKQPYRHMVATLERIRFEWKLTRLAIIPSPDLVPGKQALARKDWAIQAGYAHRSEADEDEEEARLYADDIRHGRVQPQ